MKRIIFSLMGAFLAFGAMAQPTFVSTTPANKNVVLEEYTGTNCTWCPDGHKRANEFAVAHPGRVVLINIHQGSFAGSNPNYKTVWGDALANQTGLQGYPSGTINRRVFTGTATALDRGSWATDGGIVLNESSFVNVAAQAQIDAATRIMTVTVEAYYTGDADASTNMLNVALIQNDVVGPQVGMDKNSAQITLDGKYIHMHMLRDLITGQWGDSLNSASGNIPAGTFFTKTYIDTLPTSINNVPLELVDLEIAAFVSKDHQTIYTGSLCEPTYTNLTPISAKIFAAKVSADMGCNETASPSIMIKNMGSDTITTMEIGYKSGTNAQQIYNWTGSVSSSGKTAEIVLPQLNVVLGTSTPVELEIKSINGITQTGITSTTNILKPILPDAVGKAKLRLYLDQYGSETSWNVKNSSGTIVAQGGVYTDAAAAGTRLIESEFNLATAGCYTFEIKDKYGDGINSGYGVGGYTIIDNDSTIIASSNGKYGLGEKKDIKLVSSIGLNDVENNISSLNVYPNPVKDIATLDITLSENTNATIQVVDLMGRTVIDLGTKSFKAGQSSIELNTTNLSNGMYFVKINSNNGVATKKITVSK
jgi:hypothetical protein